MKKVLEAVLLPDNSLQLEWGTSGRRISKTTQLLQDEIFSFYEKQPRQWLLFLGFADTGVDLSSSLDFWRSFSALFVRHLRLTPDLDKIRHKVLVPVADEEINVVLERAPAMVGGEYLSPELLRSLWGSLNEVFSRAISAFSGSLAEFIHHCSPNSNLLGRVYFHLVENREGDYPFAFLATYSTVMGGSGTSRHLPLKYALQEYREDRDKLLELLSTVYKAAGESVLLGDLLESNELFSPLAWSSEETYTFLQEVPLYEDAGILCRIPDWWKARKAGIKVRLSLGEQQPAMVGMEALLDFSPHLMLGEEEISPQEARMLLEQVEGLAFIKNKWVEVDREKLEQSLVAYEEARRLARDGGISLAEAMRLMLRSGKGLLAESKDDVLEVKHGQWLQSLFAGLANPSRLPQVALDKGFRAELRPYQHHGLHWLCRLHSLGFGGCLADDMGLGKTVQVLAFLHVLAEEQPGRPSLLVIPASLLANWEQEIARFSPELRVFFAHPSMHKPHRVRPLDSDDLARYHLVITTYALVTRYDWLGDIDWQYVILDEAQAIKNPNTRQTKSVKNLSAVNRIVMTGTPVENRLSDFWSLFDFINPGLLGTVGEFKAFSRELAEHPDGYGRLRQMTGPFILRRLKSDKTIIADLPDKVELKSWADLSRKQAVIYQKLVNDINIMLDDVEGIQRKGTILAALTKFKQICNHPDQYTGMDGYAEKESGKFARLREICLTIHAKREQVLVFTQFKEMTGPLARFLETIFGRPGLVLHGSVPVVKRKKIIEQFQTARYIPFMVLSLKAGGVGLNLTRANHVIHFDRWWNPAVEDQATDRAFRIGQQKKVMVHKFITRGTIEEKIDGMLEAKKQLARDVVASGGETWLTEMDNDALRDLFSLSR